MSASLPAICGSKTPLSRTQAKLSYDRHQRRECLRCRSGAYRWNRYACPLPGPPHWHVGHQYRDVGHAGTLRLGIV